MTTPLILETLAEVVDAGDPESAAEATTMLRFLDSHAIHVAQQADFARLDRLNPTLPTRHRRRS